MKQSNRRDFLRDLGTGVTAVAIWSKAGRLAASGPESRPGDKPNFVILLSDDHGLWDTGCYGNKVIRTPHIDALARQGLRFTGAFTATAMCAPSRSMLYTGLFPHRNGAHPNHSAARPGVRSIPHYLRPLGYEVALAGKTHIKPRTVFPFRYMARTDVNAFLAANKARPFCLVIATNDPHAPYKKGSLYRPRDVPLPPTLLDTPQTRQTYADYCHSVAALDEQVGQFAAMLDRHGLADRTAFIYTSDHGSGFPFSKWTLYDGGLNVPFIVRWPGRVKPGTVTAAMISFVDVLPTLMEIAGQAPPADLDGRSFLPVLLGRKDEHRDLVYGTHTNKGIISGTFYPIRAVRTRTHKYIRNLYSQGVFTNILTEGRSGPRANANKANKAGKASKAKKAAQRGGGQAAGDADETSQAADAPVLWQSWLDLARRDPAAAKRVRMYQHRPPEELYDLRTDPHELNNVAADPANRDILANLRQKLKDWMVQQDDPELKLWK